MQLVLRQTVITLCLCSLIFPNLFAQSSPGNPGVRIGVINSALFQESAGVSKLINTQNIAEAEFKHKKEELKELQGKAEALSRSIKNSSGNNYQSKYEELEKLNRDIKSKGDLYQVQYQKRYNDLLTPIYTAMGTALQQWSKQKGYDLVVDIAKDEKGTFIWVAEPVIAQSTADLIRYFNSVIK